jgi:hypothetical protein
MVMNAKRNQLGKVRIVQIELQVNCEITFIQQMLYFRASADRWNTNAKVERNRRIKVRQTQRVLFQYLE